MHAQANGQNGYRRGLIRYVWNGKYRQWGVCLGLKQPDKIRWATVAVGSGHACGIVKATRRLHCWGSDYSRQVTGWFEKRSTCRRTRYKAGSRGDGRYTECQGQAKGTKWLMVSAGQSLTCAITQTSRKLVCWGYVGTSTVWNFNYLNRRGGVVNGRRDRNYVRRWANVAVAGDNGGHACGTTEDSYKPICWGFSQGGQLLVKTKDVQWDLEPSCFIQHAELDGPASCTMCRKGCHHTIVDPMRNAGTCTKKQCPMCKPKSCCGKHHKHYVYNTESLEGVCVRHNNDCTAVCVPSKPDPTKRRVCSKGCNRMLKVLKPKPKKGASTDAELFDIVVCQVDHRIVCQAWGSGRGKSGSGRGGRRLLEAETRRKKSPCKTTKWVKPVARCVNFDAAVWNSGATCLVNAARRRNWTTKRYPGWWKRPLGCGGKMSWKDLSKVKRCKPSSTAIKADAAACQPFAQSLVEYY